MDGALLTGRTGHFNHAHFGRVKFHGAVVLGRDQPGRNHAEQKTHACTLPQRKKRLFNAETQRHREIIFLLDLLGSANPLNSCFSSKVFYAAI
jgi:hypothetical protein